MAQIKWSGILFFGRKAYAFKNVWEKYGSLFNVFVFLWRQREKKNMYNYKNKWRKKIYFWNKTKVCMWRTENNIINWEWPHSMFFVFTGEFYCRKFQMKPQIMCGFKWWTISSDIICHAFALIRSTWLSIFPTFLLHTHTRDQKWYGLSDFHV